MLGQEGKGTALRPEVAPDLVHDELGGMLATMVRVPWVGSEEDHPDKLV